MRILLDTSAYSSFMRGHRGIKKPFNRRTRLLSIRSSWVNCRPGFNLVGIPDQNRKTLKQFLASPRVRVVAMDEETAERSSFTASVGDSGASGRCTACSGLTSRRSFFKPVAQVLVHRVALT